MPYVSRMPHVRTRPTMDHALAHKIRVLVRKVAAEYDVPPAFIPAHIRLKKADEARKKVWRVMIVQMGFSRQQVAQIFDRHPRRLRKSVIGV